MGAIQYGDQERKVNASLRQAGIDPDDPNVSSTLLNTARGLVQKGYDPRDIATFIGDEGVQRGVFGSADVANQAIAGLSKEDIEALRSDRPGPSSTEVVGADGVTEIIVEGRGRGAVDTLADGVLRPVMEGAAALGQFAERNRELAELAVAGTQIALGGAAAFVKNTVVDAIVGNTIGPYMDQFYGYVQGKAAGFIENNWGFEADEANFLAGGVAFAGQLVVDSSTSRIIDSSQNISRIARDEKGRFKSDPLSPKSPYTYTDSQRRADWKRLAQDPNSPLTPDERIEIEQRGWRGPQQVNKYGELETMELSHEPVPLREGGREVYPRWPEDHARVDPHRHLKNRDK